MISRQGPDLEFSRTKLDPDAPVQHATSITNEPLGDGDEMVIGLVVHAGHQARFADAASTLTGVEFAWAVYEREDEIRDRVLGLLGDHRIDGLLLGLVPYA